MNATNVKKLSPQSGLCSVEQIPMAQQEGIGPGLLVQRFGEDFATTNVENLLNALDNRLALAQGLVRTTGSLATAWRDGSGVDMQALCSVFVLIEEELRTAALLGQAIGDTLPDRRVGAGE